MKIKINFHVYRVTRSINMNNHCFIFSNQILLVFYNFKYQTNFPISPGAIYYIAKYYTNIVYFFFIHLFVYNMGHLYLFLSHKKKTTAVGNTIIG